MGSQSQLTKLSGSGVYYLGAWIGPRRGHPAWDHLPTLPLTRCVTWSKLLDLYRPQFPLV